MMLFSDKLLCKIFMKSARIKKKVFCAKVNILNRLYQNKPFEWKKKKISIILDLKYHIKKFRFKGLKSDLAFLSDFPLYLQGLRGPNFREIFITPKTQEKNIASKCTTLKTVLTNLGSSKMAKSVWKNPLKCVIFR